ncbi:MAG TPA: hypothetical protein VKA15_20155, partial [Isosphaeraceae bacterium]|nr:hypothetical protein [Isosphaeraceae bacterium]
TATYWEVGRRVVELEQRGQVRAAYGDGLWKRLAIARTVNVWVAMEGDLLDSSKRLIPTRQEPEKK